MASNLREHPVYQARAELLSEDDRVFLTYHRAKQLIRSWNLSIEDIRTCSPKFWAFQADPLLALDGAMTNILACHINLFLGTLSYHVRRNPYVRPVIEAGLKADVLGNFLLSEVGHGLDILNLETRATKVHDGFILHTPHPRAAKIMPPTTPIPGFQKWAVVFARMFVDGEDRGIHPFLVQTNDDKGMCPGVTSSRLPPRAGSTPLDFAITHFNEVHLPLSAFLGIGLEKPDNVQFLLHYYIRRIGLGTAILPMHVINGLGLIATIGADYSFRRHVQGKGSEKVPIISFRTQQIPILNAVAVAHVFKAWIPNIIEVLMSTDTDPRIIHGVGVVFKATVTRITTIVSQEAGERMGGQGLFGHNLIATMENDARGIGIAEGDILVLCIRLFSELLLQRYSLPEPKHHQTLLARHASGVFSQAAEVLASLSNGHRDPAFNRLILPRSQLAITAVGHALAYSAALDAGVPQSLLDVFESLVITLDEGWYVEHAGLTQEKRILRQDRAVLSALPHIKEYVDALDLRKYENVPIKSDEVWDAWVPLLKTHRREGSRLAIAEPEYAIARL